MASWFLGYLFILHVFGSDIKNSSMDHNYTATPESIHLLSLERAVSCKFQPNNFNCEGGRRPRQMFYYDLLLQDCKSASVGFCPYNLNTFGSLSDCHNSCRDVGTHPVPEDLAPGIYCRLQYDFGNCNGYNPRWYFDVSIRRCRGFSYSGCGGNLNRFRSQQACATACGGAISSG